MNKIENYISKPLALYLLIYCSIISLFSLLICVSPVYIKDSYNNENYFLYSIFILIIFISSLLPVINDFKFKKWLSIISFLFLFSFSSLHLITYKITNYAIERSYSKLEKQILKDKNVNNTNYYNEFILKKESLDIEYIVNFKEKYQNNLFSVNDDKILNLIIISKNNQFPSYITNKILEMKKDSFISINEYNQFKKDIIEHKYDEENELISFLIK